MLPLGDWCLAWDFNSIENKSERKSLHSPINRSEMIEFRNFVGSMELIDLIVFGGKFTRFKLDGSVMSIFDRFLLSEGLLSARKVENQFIGSRSIFFYHNPTWIKGTSLTWGPKPFKIFNSWMKHEDFIPF